MSFWHSGPIDLYMGCNKEQMERVKAGIDWLEANDDLYYPEED